MHFHNIFTVVTSAYINKDESFYLLDIIQAFVQIISTWCFKFICSQIQALFKYGFFKVFRYCVHIALFMDRLFIQSVSENKSNDFDLLPKFLSLVDSMIAVYSFINDKMTKWI